MHSKSGENIWRCEDHKLAVPVKCQDIVLSKSVYFSHCAEMVFCYQNCSDLLWEKNCSSDREKRLKFEAEGREFAKILRSLEQFIQTVVRTILGNRMLF